MRKLLSTVVLAMLATRCANENPLGPGSVTVSRSTSTTVATTTSTIAPGTNAVFIFSPQTPGALQVVSFSAFGSTAAPGRTIAGYSWDFGDGTTKVGVSATHDFSPQGIYIVTLTVTDSSGEKATTSQPVAVGVALPSTTTTTITTNSAVRYVNPAQTDPSVPADLTLFFQLLTGQSTVSSVRSTFARFTGFGSFEGAAVGDARYSVRGVYQTGNGATG